MSVFGAAIYIVVYHAFPDEFLAPIVNQSLRIQFVLDTGLYGHVRHPSIMGCSRGCLASHYGRRAGRAIAVLAFLPVLLAQIRIEEQTLCGHKGMVTT